MRVQLEVEVEGSVPRRHAIPTATQLKGRAGRTIAARAP
jgi:hypothetical protein